MASCLSRARARIIELEAEDAQRKQLAALGLSNIPYPSDFCCPVTWSKFVDPVVASDGHTYERSAITDVIESGNGLSPLTREPLETYLTVNRCLLSRMRAYEVEALQVAQLAAAAEAQRHITAAAAGASLGGDVATGSEGAKTAREICDADAEVASSDDAGDASCERAIKRRRLDDDAGGRAAAVGDGGGNSD